MLNHLIKRVVVFFRLIPKLIGHYFYGKLSYNSYF